MRVILLALAVLIVLPATQLEAQKRCKKGIPCGNTCIAANKTCRIGTSAPRSSPPPAATVAPAQQSGQAQQVSGDWVASSRGRTYYKAGCSGARKLSASNLIYFKSEEDAQKAGYTRSVQRGC